MSEDPGETIAVPLLHPCVSCGLPVEVGDGPGELAWHDCEWVLELTARTVPPPPPPPPGMEVLLERMTMAISAKAERMTPRELADTMGAAADLIRAQNEANNAEGKGSGGVSGKLLAFLATR